MKPIAILYEHPQWFAPLFAELNRRGLPFESIHAHEHRFDPDDLSLPHSLVVNRVSPSSYLRDHTSAIFHTAQYLTHLESAGMPIVNGSKAFALEISKARQLGLLARLGILHPRGHVVNSVGQIEPAANELEYPLIVKPNIGGSGALMSRFDAPTDLRSALANGELHPVFGPDHTAIVQEYHPPIDGSIVRIEVLDGRFLYAIRIYNDASQGFNLCPADICQVDTVQRGEPPASSVPHRQSAELNLVPEPKKELKIEVAQPPSWIVDDVLRIFRAGSIDVGGVEYLESERDGRLYAYDVNALSNFVTDAPALVGFDPFVRLVDYLERRAALSAVEQVA